MAIIKLKGNPMKNIYIVGGDGFVYDCHTYIMRMAEKDAEINFAGILGEGGHKPNLRSLASYWNGDVADFRFGQDDYAVIGSGHPEIRKRICGL